MIVGVGVVGGAVVVPCVGIAAAGIGGLIYWLLLLLLLVMSALLLLVHHRLPNQLVLPLSLHILLLTANGKIGY